MIRHCFWLIAALVIFCAGCGKTVHRYASVIGLKADAIDEYKQLHANAWPGVKEKLKRAHIQNYSIYLAQMHEGQYYLFGYFEYTGKDFAADIAAVDKDPETQRWLSVIVPMQIPLEGRQPGEWMAMEEVFHLK